MAQKITFPNSSINSTKLLNDHIAKLISAGPYSGLLVSASDSPLSLNISSGYALTDEGVKIEETIPVEKAVQLEPADPTLPRIDLVIMHHRNSYDRLVPAEYRVVKGHYPVSTSERPAAAYTDLVDGDIALAEVYVPAAAAAIDDSYIENVRRTYTTSYLADAIYNSLFYSVGNVTYSGWKTTELDPTHVTVSPGEGLINGRAYQSVNNINPSTLRKADTLLSGAFSSASFSLTKQPFYPSKLRIKLHAVGTPIQEGTLSIKGIDAKTNTAVTEEITIGEVAAAEFVELYTEHTFSRISDSGISISGTSFASGYEHHFNVYDCPVVKLYLTGSHSETPKFRLKYIEQEASHEELLLADIFMNENGLERIVEYDNRNPKWVSDDALRIAREAKTLAQKALAAADGAVQDAADALTAAANAERSAAGAEQTADNALAKVITAENKAVEAITAANEAKTLAGTANTNAASALTNANKALEDSASAVAEASTALSTANTAKDTADGAAIKGQQGIDDAAAVDTRVTTVSNQVTTVDSRVTANDIEIAELWERLQQIASYSIPVGIILPFTRGGRGPNIIPAGFLPCDGAEYDKSTYAALFNIIGNTWGTSSNPNKFKVPDLRSKFLQGENYMEGIRFSGPNPPPIFSVGTDIGAGLPNITGTFYFTGASGSYGTQTGCFYKYSNETGYQHGTGGSNQNPKVGFEASRSSSIYGKSNTVQPPSVVVNFIIKY